GLVLGRRSGFATFISALAALGVSARRISALIRRCSAALVACLVTLRRRSRLRGRLLLLLLRLARRLSLLLLLELGLLALRLLLKLLHLLHVLERLEVVFDVLEASGDALVVRPALTLHRLATALDVVDRGLVAVFVART